jgi:hypothetical protein
MSNIHKDSEDHSKKVDTEAGKGPMQINDQRLKDGPFSKEAVANKGKAQEVKKVTVKK